MDNERSKQSSSEIKDWIGQYSDVSPERIPNGGSEIQINCFSLRTGELTSRSGLVFLSLLTLDE